MRIFRGLRHQGIAPGCALTIGNFDGVHLGHQAMLGLLKREAAQRGVASCVLTFEPHPRDYFAAARGQPGLAPACISTLRDKLAALACSGVDQTVVLPFNAALARLSAEAFIRDVLVAGLKARYVLAGDDFRFGARRAGDDALLAVAGTRLGFDMGRMPSHEIGGVRVSSSAVRAALAEGRMRDAERLLGRPYAISGHVVYGRALGRALGESMPGRGDGFRTLNLRFERRAHLWHPAASGIFVVEVHGLADHPLPGVANLGVRPSLNPDDVNGGRVLLETHCLNWPLGHQEAYGHIVRVDLLHKLHDERRYPSLDALAAGIAQDCVEARAFFAARG
jgi:riboflavin kinase/FMN adenylyltransferase